VQQLNKYNIAESLTNISWSAFADCSELKEALFLGNQPEALGGFIFANADTEFKIKVSQNAVGFGKPTPYNDKTSWEWSIDFNPIYNVVISEIPTDEVIAFRDEYLKSIVSEAIGKSDDDVIYKSDLDKITFLSLVPPEVIKEPIDLSELAMLTNLERLYVREFSLGDMTPFAHLTNLTELKISYCSIDDLRPLKNLTKLISLEMHFTGISDISVLKGLTNLEHLNLANNNISDISALENLTKLQYLYLSGNDIKDFSPLLNLTNLKFTDIDL
jgi:hypothetical protein